MGQGKETSVTAPTSPLNQPFMRLDYTQKSPPMPARGNRDG